jgi:hypothetical protein
MEKLQARAVTLLASVALVASAISANAAVRTEVVSFTAGQVQSRSFLVYDDSLKGRRPGILVVPEFWG